MKIIIKYENKKFNIITKDYQSINSIVNQCLSENNIDENINNYFIEYNGKYLNKDYSLEKYNIISETVLTLNRKKRGGDGFFAFIGKHPKIAIASLIISLLPLIILPMGFVPFTASLMKLIIDKGFESIGRYLVCVLGKITIFKRIKLFITVIKYIIFILMVFVIITFPLLLLCVTLKGHSILDNPSGMCKAITSGNTAGLILTAIYAMIYISLRFGDSFLNFVINIFKKIYILNTNINPILQTILKSYDQFKYMPVLIIPVLGQLIGTYFGGLMTFTEAVKDILASIVEIGCSPIFDKNALMKSIINKANKKIKNKLQSDDNDNDKIKSFEKPEDICIIDTDSECCKAGNYINIGDTLTDIIKNPLTSLKVKEFKIFPSVILMIQAFYESALSKISNTENNLSGSNETKKFYLKKVLQEKINVLDDNLKNLIKEYLENGNNELIDEIKNKMNTSTNKDKQTINEIKVKLLEIDQIMLNFSKKDGSIYIPGGSLFKTIMKILLVDVFCNLSATTKGAENIISKMGEMDEVVDMLKAGSTAGIFTAIVYFITVIVLIICGIFNVF
jgi:regulator of sigma D